MTEKTPWPVNEAVHHIPEGLLRGGYAVFAVAMAVVAAVTDEWLIRALCVIWVVLIGGIVALLERLNRHYRVEIDENGAAIGQKHSLQWTQVRTAAVIQRGDPALNTIRRHKDEDHFILLSLQEPEKAIDKWTFRLEAARPGMEVRIPYTDKRRAAVEHYLGKTLPIIRL